MKNKQPTVALIFGGMGQEHDVSLSGAPYLFSLIDKEKFNIVPLLLQKDGIMVSAEISERGNIVASDTSAHFFRMFGKGGVIIDGDFTPLSCAIPLLHGDYGEDGTVQGALTTVGIPYIGCDITAGSVCLDKIFTKILAEHLGIPVAKYRYFMFCNQPDLDFAIKDIEEHLGYPVIIKPVRLGSSFGISKAENRAELKEAFRKAYLAGGGRILAEEFIKVKKEVECACFLTSKAKIFTSPGSVCVGDGIYDYEKKYSQKNGALISAESNVCPEITELIKKYSSALAELVGIRHLSRIDFFLTEDEKIIFNEINTFPGFTKDSLYPKLIERAGISSADAINAMLCEVIGL